MDQQQRIIIANWKMNLDIDESRELAVQLRNRLKDRPSGPGIELAVCPSFDAIATVGEILEGTGVALGSQDVFWQEKGAYTGEISASMLRALGVSLSIIGHSERRKYLHEDNEMANRKVRAALAQGLMPVLCVGETYEERSEGHADLVLMREVIEGLQGLTLKPEGRIVVAYEPVWVIGTGQAIDPAMAERASQVINQSLIDLFPPATIARQIRIVYGGSVDASNIREYLDLQTIHGALVGTASINAEKFLSLIAEL